LNFTDHGEADLGTRIAKALAIALCIAGLLTGCGGGGAKVQQSTTTMGQELMDLEASYKQGIITEKEYNRAKAKILKKYR
jgi:hypothetical protein